METKATKRNVYEMVTDRVLEQMQQGIIPWHKPWTGTQGTINYVTRRPYSMLNQMLLGREGEWITYKQLKERGGKIKKGAKAGFVVFYSPYSYEKEVTQEDGTTIKEIKTMPVLKYYNVFHIDDCTGIESKNEEKPARELKPVERAEEIVNGYVEREHLKFQNDKPSDRACYSPISDRVIVPMLSQYDIVEEYYSTTFHELTHSTMLKNRCDRTNGNILAAFGSSDYSREELVAELGAAYLCTAAELDNQKAFKNSVAYLQGWLKALKNDSKMIVWAASRAEKAVRYILGENVK